MIKNLVFKGGGVLGIAYVGVIEVLEEKQILQQIQRVAGTSAGAIVATLLSLKCNAAEVFNLFQSTDFNLFGDSADRVRVGPKYGLYKGMVFLSWIKKCITDKGLSENATFSDFEKAGMLDLHVFATDLNTNNLKEFSVAKTPHVIVAEAIRASMSIPLFFDTWTFSNAIPDNHVYIDGGTLCNFPIKTFDSNNIINTETLGFFLQNTGNTDEIDMEAIDFENNPEEKKRVVVIDTFAISSTNFALTDAEKVELYLSGKTATANYLEKLYK